MRVIFLDIDGVLNSERYVRERRPQASLYDFERRIDPVAVGRLNRLVALTRAKIVISSSWRKLLEPTELGRVLGKQGLRAEIIGVTPDGCNCTEVREAFDNNARIFRGHEIEYWLRQHPEVDRFVILDDGSDMEMHKNRLVQTDCAEGLLDAHVELAIRVLSWDGKDPAVLPQQDESFREPPGSSVGIHCNAQGCVETLTLTRTTTVPPSHEDDYLSIMPACDGAAVFLGWRVHHSVWWCPTHVVAKCLECPRCRLVCPACSCARGPSGDAVEGMSPEGMS